MMGKMKLKKALKKATGCTIQHNGWTCGTCFFAISDELNNPDWQNVLLIRGDYAEEDLDHLPADRQESYNKIINECEG